MTGGHRASDRRDGTAGRRQLAASVLAAALLTALTALAVVAAARDGAPLPGDLALHEAAVDSRSRLLTEVAIGVTTTGSGVPAYVLAAVAGAVAVRRRPVRIGSRLPSRWWAGAAAAVLAVAAGQLVRAVLAAAIGRARPPMADWAWDAGGPALPSGHATTSGLVAGLWCGALSGGRSQRVGTVVALGWAAAVGLTRVELGVHWPSDVLAGWLLATALVLGADGLRRATAIRAAPGGPGAPRDRVGAGP